MRKEKLTEDVNSKDTAVRGKAVKDLIKNADDRLKEFEKEEDAIKKSEQDFKKAKVTLITLIMMLNVKK